MAKRILSNVALIVVFGCLGAALAALSGCGGGDPSAMMPVKGPSATCKDACAGWEAAGCAPNDDSGDLLAGCLATCDKMPASWRSCFTAAESCPAADACK